MPKNRRRPRLKLRVNEKKQFINSMESVAKSLKENSADSSAAVEENNDSVKTVPNQNAEDCLRISDIVHQCVCDFTSRKILRYVRNNYEIDEKEIMLQIEVNLQEYVKAGWLKPKNINEDEKIKYDRRFRFRDKKSKKKVAEAPKDTANTHTREELENNEAEKVKYNSETHFRNERKEKIVVPLFSKGNSLKDLKCGWLTPNSRVSTEEESKNNETGKFENESEIYIKNNVSNVSRKIVTEPITTAKESLPEHIKFECLMTNSSTREDEELKNNEAEKVKYENNEIYFKKRRRRRRKKIVPLSSKQNSLKDLKCEWLTPNFRVNTEEESKYNEARKLENESKFYIKNSASRKAITEPIIIGKESLSEHIKIRWRKTNFSTKTDEQLKNNEAEKVEYDNSETHFKNGEKKKIVPLSSKQKSLKDLKCGWPNSRISTDEESKNNKAGRQSNESDIYTKKNASRKAITESITDTKESLPEYIKFGRLMPNSSVRAVEESKNSGTEKVENNRRSGESKTKVIPHTSRKTLHEHLKIGWLKRSFRVSTDEESKDNELETLQHESEIHFEYYSASKKTGRNTLSYKRIADEVFKDNEGENVENEAQFKCKKQRRQ